MPFNTIRRNRRWLLKDFNTSHRRIQNSTPTHAVSQPISNSVAVGRRPDSVVAFGHPNISILFTFTWAGWPRLHPMNIFFSVLCFHFLSNQCYTGSSGIMTQDFGFGLLDDLAFLTLEFPISSISSEPIPNYEVSRILISSEPDFIFSKRAWMTPFLPD